VIRADFRLTIGMNHFRSREAAKPFIRHSYCDFLAGFNRLKMRHKDLIASVVT
jgi:hypothetical protein